MLSVLLSVFEVLTKKLHCRFNKLVFFFRGDFQKRCCWICFVLAVEFLLRRLEADKDEEFHGELGAFLFNLPEIASRQPINALLDVRRNFGLPKGQEPMELDGEYVPFLALKMG